MLVQLSDDKQFPVTYITLNRSAKLNALSHEMIVELESAIRELEKKSTNECRLVIVSSQSEKAFSVGADINDWANYSPVEAFQASQYGTKVFNDLASLPMPVIAFLDKWVLGGGLELALACDIRLATEETTLAFPETKLGNAPGWAGLTRLVPLVGPSKAKELLFTGRNVGAAEAKEIGLVNFIGTRAEVDQKKQEFIQSICANAPLPIAAAKRTIDEMSGKPSLFGFVESLVGAYTAGTEDSKIGKQSFFNKQPARFKGK